MKKSSLVVSARPSALIIGAGAAGLCAALALDDRPVTLMTSAALDAGGSSRWAQGGIAAAVGGDDSPDQHVQDTIAAGAGLVDEAMARLLATEAAARLDDLVRWGVPFDRAADGTLSLGREAAHSKNRIVHVSGDRAGASIMGTLTHRVRAAAHITVVEHAEALELVRDDHGAIAGVWVRVACGAPEFFAAQPIILATGGISALYATTTNPATILGLGLGMAAAAGAVLADSEFVQFHPTALRVGRDPLPLATEALRGAGATLVNAAGVRFLESVHPAAELAPRDVVARAVYTEIQKGGQVFLDTRAALGDSIRTQFPVVYQACIAAGIDPLRDAIPVVPAAHYHVGGVASDEHGRSTIAGLYVCGEVASTGVHGANRLASNSLLETLVMAHRVVTHIKEQESVKEIMPCRVHEPPPVADMPMAVLAQMREQMMQQAGIVRHEDPLRALDNQVRQWLDEHAANTSFRNALLAALSVVVAARHRRESRGAHYRADYPAPVPALAVRQKWMWRGDDFLAV